MKENKIKKINESPAQKISLSPVWAKDPKFLEQR